MLSGRERAPRGGFPDIQHGRSMKGLGIGLGLERIAWFLYDRPRLGLAFVLLVVALTALGLSRLSFNDDLRDIFAGDTPAYRAYTQATSEFVDPENELLVLIEGKDLGTPVNFQKLQELQLELQLVDGVDNVFSLFALRQRPDAEGNAPLLVDNPSAGLTPDLIKRIRAHPLLGDRLLSPDGSAVVFTVTPSEPRAPVSVARKLATDVSAAATAVLKGSDLKITATGFPVIRYSIADIMRRDELVLNGVGAIIGTVMSLIVFRSIIGSILAAAPAIFAALTVVGFMGLFGVKITVMSTVVPMLVMIFGYADGMHLCFAWRKYREAGHGVVEAEHLAQRELAGACSLSAITTSIAFLSLVISSVAMVRSFGWTGAVATTTGMIVVLVIHGLLVRALGRFWSVRHTGRFDNLLSALEGPCGLAGHYTVKFAKPLSLLAAILFVLLGAAHYSVKPEHSFRENLPANNPANTALGRLDRDFGGIFPIQIVVPLNGADPTSVEGLARIHAVHEAVASVAGVGQPLSLWNLAQWVGGADASNSGTLLKQMLAQTTPTTRSRFVGSNGNALVMATIHEMPSADAARLIGRIEKAVAATGVAGVTVTGVTVINARETTRTISNLNVSLLLSVVANLVVIGLAFGSVAIGVVCFLPNILPILAVGTMLFLSGSGMQFTAVIALTVAFGVAVNDSVHFINRFIHTDDSGSLAGRLVETTRHIGPVITGSTLIIIAGLSTTLTSGMPTVSLFGRIAALTLLVGIIGDVIILPALMGGPGRRWFGRQPTIKLQEASP
jgi:predicted RND superfamily exporter protein